MSDEPKLSQTADGEVWRVIGETHAMSAQALELLQQLPCRAHGERMAALEARLAAAPEEEPTGPRRPSRASEAVDRIDRHVEHQQEEITEVIRLRALVATQEAAQAQSAQSRKDDLERSTARAARFKVWSGAVVALLVALGGALGIKGCSALETLQVRTEAALKKIETKAAPVKRPDAGE